MYTLTLNMAGDSPSYHWGSSFHGLLFSLLPSEIADILHGEGQHLFSQWIEPLNHDHFIWHIGALDDTVGEVIAESIASAPKLYSSHMHTEFPVLHAQCTHTDVNQLMEDCFHRSCLPEGMLCALKTPVSHKVNGQYVNLPDISLIMNGLRKRALQICPDLIYADDEVTANLVSSVRIGKYKLQSSTFGVGGAFVVGYTGTMELKLIGSEDSNRLAWFLLRLSEWCGLGIKTALGMGGCISSPIKQSRNRRT